MGNANVKGSNLSDGEISSLKKTTHLTTEELFQWHKEFIKDVPTGRLTKTQFTSVYKDLYPQGKPEKFCDIIFKVFDKDKSNSIDFHEFVIGSTITFAKDPKEKLELIFDAYDSSDDQKINKAEVKAILQAISELNDGHSLSKHALDKKMGLIYEKFDIDSDGVITKDEFVKAVSADEDLLCLVNF